MLITPPLTGPFLPFLLLFAQARLLIEGGADVLARDRWGDTPCDDARRLGAFPVVELLEPLMKKVNRS